MRTAHPIDFGVGSLGSPDGIKRYEVLDELVGMGEEAGRSLCRVCGAVPPERRAR